ncbi:hypothetical protein OC845_005654 [Tilletia horrida]|nr:hypothetical protein OC845_005654 [Tilletia horrida]
MPMFSSPSPLLISNPSSPAVSASASPHHHHHPHYQRSSFRQPQPPSQSSNNNSYFFASSSSSTAFTPPVNGLASTSAAAPSGSGTGKRSRDDDDDDDMSAVRDGSSSPPSQHALASDRSNQQRSNNTRPIIHKKIRSFVTGQNSQNGGNQGASSTAAAPVDLGKMLASLDRPELLSLLMRLLATSQDPSLPAQIQALLPAPSLESINTTLNNLEAAIHQAIPLAGARAEYVWTRVRNPLNEFATTAIGLMEVLLQRRQQQQASATSASLNSVNTSEVDADGLVHPTTAFAFLLDLTGRVLRIERGLPPPPKSVFFTNNNASSPLSSGSASGSSGAGKMGSGNKASSSSNSQTSSFLIFKHFVQQKESVSNSAASQPAPVSVFGGFSTQQLNATRQTISSSSADALVTILVPTLLAQWDTLLRRISNAVNQQGRMFGQEVVLGWYRALNSLGSEGLPSAQSPPTNTTRTLSPTPAYTPRPSFGFGFGSNTASSISTTGFGFGAATMTSSSTSSSSFGFGSMSAPQTQQQSQQQQQAAEVTHRVEEEALRVAMDWVRDVFEREIGWLVGLDKMRAAAAGSDMRS